MERGLRISQHVFSSDFFYYFFENLGGGGKRGIWSDSRFVTLVLKFQPLCGVLKIEKNDVIFGIF